MRLVKKIRLKFGSRSDQPPLELEPSAITVFVGPNNSGKSLVLREIERLCAINDVSNSKILDGIDFSFPDPEALKQQILASKVTPSASDSPPVGHIVVQRINPYSGLPQRENVPLHNVNQWVLHNDRFALIRYFISLLTVRLDGATRTTLLNPAHRSDLLDAPTNILGALFLDADARNAIRKITNGAFGKHFVIDAMHQHLFRARLSDRAPDDELEEQSYDTRARNFHRNAIEIVDASDGVKAFTGMLAAVIGQKCRIPLIDEPEAFLHPPLAKRLGQELAEAANRLEASVFVATHSSHFLMGCLAGNPQVNIVRLTYKRGQASARLLTHDKLQQLTKSALMRSSGVLAALFHEGAIVCEGDSDRAFYEEINSRILASDSNRGAEALFLNARNKQSTGKVAGSLRQMGIPAAVVVDFDIFNGNDDYKQMLKDLGISAPIAQGWCQTKSLLAVHYEKLKLKEKGLAGIADEETRSSFLTLINFMQGFGIFVVPNGELESWKPAQIDQTSDKRQWLINAFAALGDDPEQPSYVWPGEGDVWDFLKRIGGWINDQDRAGV